MDLADTPGIPKFESGKITVGFTSQTTEYTIRVICAIIGAIVDDYDSVYKIVDCTVPLLTEVESIAKFKVYPEVEWAEQVLQWETFE